MTGSKERASLVLVTRTSTGLRAVEAETPAKRALVDGAAGMAGFGGLAGGAIVAGNLVASVAAMFLGLVFMVWKLFQAVRWYREQWLAAATNEFERRDRA